MTNRKNGDHDSDGSMDEITSSLKEIVSGMSTIQNQLREIADKLDRNTPQSSSRASWATAVVWTLKVSAVLFFVAIIAFLVYYAAVGL